jgi:hypothetical protein
MDILWREQFQVFREPTALIFPIVNKPLQSVDFRATNRVAQNKYIQRYIVRVLEVFPFCLLQRKFTRKFCFTWKENRPSLLIRIISPGFTSLIYFAPPAIIRAQLSEATKNLSVSFPEKGQDLNSSTCGRVFTKQRTNA